MARLFDDALSEYLEINQAVLSAFPLAMVCFFNSNDINQTGDLLAIADSGSSNNYLRLIAQKAANGNTIYAMSHDGTPGSAITSTGYTANTWHHACGIWAASNYRRAFIDGGSRGADSVNVNPSSLDKTSIGRLGRSVPTSYFSGMVAEAAIYDLSAYPGATDIDKAEYFEANILPHLAAGEPPEDYQTGLIAYWPLRDDDLDNADGFDLIPFNTPSWAEHPPMVRYIEGSVAGASNVSGILSFAKVFIKLESSADGISGADGSLNIAKKLIGFTAGISNVSGSFTFAKIELQGLTVGTSNVSGFLKIVTKLQGSLTQISNVSGSLKIATKLRGSLTQISNVSGSLKIATKLRGSTDGISTITGVLRFIKLELLLVGSLAVTSGVSGSLDSQPELQSSLAATSGITGFLNVSTELISSSTVISGITGFLNVLTELIGYLSSELITGGLLVTVGLEVSKKLISSASGISNLPDGTNYLSIVPDFEAATLFWRPESNIIETLEWRTSVLKAYDGTEQRIKVRQSPRQYFKLRLFLETNKANTWFDSVIHTWQKLAWLIPIWTEYVKHSADIVVKDDSIDVDTTNADFRNSSKAIVWKSASEYEVIVIDTKTDSQLNLSYSMLNSFTGEKYVIPVRTAYLISSSKKERYNSGVSIIDLIFAVYDNVSIEGYNPNFSYDGLEVLSIPAFMDNTHGENSDADIFITDFETGIFKVESTSNFNFLSQSHNFFNDIKSTCWNFRKFLHSLNGRQKTVLIPTFREDFVQTNSVGVLDTSVNIENIGLAENMGFNSLRTYIGFYFSTTEILVVRKIIAITEIDSAEEQITFDANLGLASAIEVGDCKICFVDKCRLTSDRIEIRWPYAHRNECKTNFMRVP